MNPTIIVDGEICWNPAYDFACTPMYTFIHNRNIIAIGPCIPANAQSMLTAVAFGTKAANKSTRSRKAEICKIRTCGSNADYKISDMNRRYEAFVCNECYEIIRNIQINATNALYNHISGKYAAFDASGHSGVACIRTVRTWWPNWQNIGDRCHICECRKRISKCNCENLSRQIFMDIAVPKYLLMKVVIECIDIVQLIMLMIIRDC